MKAKTETTTLTSKAAALKVLVVEDDGKLRELYEHLINSSKHLQCVGAFDRVESAVEVLDDLLPEVILMDIGLPGMSGIEGVKRIKALHPSIDILMITVFDDDQRMLESICAGASGYVLKDSEPDELLGAIRQIQTGAPMSPSIARRVLGLMRKQNPPADHDYHLTPRETDILQWLVEGLSFKQIGDQLFISPLTVHSHIKRIYEKLQVHSKSAAVAKAVKGRLFS